MNEDKGKNGDVEKDEVPSSEGESAMPEIVDAAPGDVDGIKIKSKPAVVAPTITLKGSGVSASLDDAADDTAQTQVMPAPIQPQGAQRPGGMLVSRKQGGPPGPPASGGAVGQPAPQEPEKPFVERYRTALIAVTAVLGVLLLVGIFFLVKSLTTPESEKILAESAKSMDSVNVEVTDSDDLSDLRDAARSAAQARNKNASLITRANENLSGDDKVQVAGVLAANAKVLDSYSAMAGASPRNYLKNRRAFSKMRSGVKNANRSLHSAADAAVAADVKPKFDSAALDSAADQSTDVLDNAETKLNSWDRARRKRKAAKRKFDAQAANLNNINDRLFNSRDRTEDWVGRSSSCTDGAALESMKSERAAIASSASSASAGPLLQSAKSSLVSATSKSRDSIDTLGRIWAGWSCTSGPDTIRGEPGYDSDFRPLTEDVNRDVEAFKSAMSSAQSQASSKYRAPKMPEV